MSEKDWTKGSIIHNLLTLSWPTIVAELVFVVGLVADMIWVGRLGAASVAALGIATFINAVVIAVLMGFVVGARAIVARFVGAGDIKGSNHTAAQAILTSAAFGILIAVMGVPLSTPVMCLFGTSADVIAEGSIYLRIIFAGSLFRHMLNMIVYTMQASGDALTTLKLTIFTRVVHLSLGPALILGWWIFPRWGIAGAALGLIFAQIIGTGIGFWYFFSGRTRLHLSPADFRPDLHIIWRILKIGVPASIMGLQRSFGNLVFMWLTVPFGTLAVAAHSVIGRVEMFLGAPSLGLGIGVATLVGQNLGARKPERAEKSAWLAAGIIEALMVVCSAAMLLWPDPIVGIFSTEADLVELSSTFLKIATAGFLVMALVTVFQYSISGAGDTLPAMVVSLTMIWGVQLPLAFLLPHIADLGVYGTRWALVAGTITGTIAYTTYFKLGRWRKKKV